MRRDGYIKWADAFILLYSITDTQSYQTVRSLRDSISEIKQVGSSVALVANKSDLSHLRQVSPSTTIFFFFFFLCFIFSLFFNFSKFLLLFQKF